MTKEQNGDRRAKWLRVAVHGGIMALAVLVIALARGAFQAQSLKEAAGILSDSCLIPGVLLAGAGGLGYAASKGAYDSLGYMFSRFSLHSLLPARTSEKRPASLYEYKQEKDQKGRRWTPDVLLTGLCALALSAVFLVMYSVL